jgi:hypothetical protein
MHYSEAFKRRMVQKLSGPGAISAYALAKEEGVSQTTLSLAAMGFFENGGSRLWVVRTGHHTDDSDPASREAGESATLFSSAGALGPPYDPAPPCLLVEHSNALRQSLDAYAVNIDCFGHDREPAIDFEAEDADAIFLERSAARERGEFGGAKSTGS